MRHRFAHPHAYFVIFFSPNQIKRAKKHMVKILQLKQPYASMLVHGLMDVVHLDTHPEQTPSHIFVYATEPVIDIEAPLEWLQEVRNQQLRLD